MSQQPHKPVPAPQNNGFVRTFALTATITLALLIALVFIVDPYDALPFSPPLNRKPATTNQRFAYPAIARSPQFDSLIIGTSTTRMLRPPRLDKALGTRFANLSLNSGTWWEQTELLKLFLRHHPRPKMIIWGIDVIWCPMKESGPKLTPRPFPKWLYDEVSWDHALYHLNFKSIENAGQSLGILLGINRPAFHNDGFRNLNWRGAPYDLKKARRRIYGNVSGRPFPSPRKKPAISDAQLAAAPYPNVAHLRTVLVTLPENTRVFLMMVPYHRYALGPRNGKNELRYRECKLRVAKLADARANTQFIDFMFQSSFTTTDTYYWDSLHYNDAGMKKIENALIAAIKRQSQLPDYVRTRFID